MSKGSSVLASLLCLTALLSADSGEIAWTQTRNSDQSQEKCCKKGPQHMRISARHIEGKGVGYKQGYTTLEAFLAPDEETWAFMPFLDVRGHVFDNGKWAANAGLGGRWRWGCRAYGINAYYDYRDSKKNYNQIGVGLESLGTVWDLRVNGYFPVGSKISRPYRTRFSRFQGHNMLLSRKYEFTMKGFDGEVGGHFGPRNWDLFAGVGPYYFDGEMGPHLWGGKARFYAKWKDYIGLQVSYSYDNVFKNIVQGEVTLSVPFGPRPKVKTNRSNCNTCCDPAYKLDMRMVQPVFRDEIIVLNTHRKRTLAIDPATGKPFFFLFVNNLSHSLGTFESPFNTLATAENASGPNDIIYVFPGDGTTTGMDAGITLQDGQQLLGATLDYNFTTTVGTVTVPAQASTFLPAITSGSGPVVTLANNNTVSGFFIENLNGQGVLGSGITNATISNNYIQGPSSLSFVGVELDNVTGTATVANNSMTGQTNSVLINNTTPISNTSYNITNNTFHVGGGNNMINITFRDGSSNTINIANNTIDNGDDDQAISITCINSTPNLAHTINISGNEIYASESPILIQASKMTTNLTISDNSIFSATDGSSINLGVGSHMTGAINNNYLNSNYYHISLTLDGASTFSGTINQNTFFATDDDDILFISNSNNAVLSPLTISGNTFIGGYQAIDLGNANGAGPSSYVITQNVCKYQSGYGIDITNNSSTPATYTVDQNSISGFNYNGISVNQSGSSSLCLELNNNTSGQFANAFLITQTAGTLNLVPPTNNVGQLTETGTITPVTSCP